jgi:hypothetical protein
MTKPDGQFFSSQLYIAANFNVDFWICPHLAKANQIGEGRMMRNEKDLPTHDTSAVPFNTAGEIVVVFGYTAPEFFFLLPG